MMRRIFKYTLKAVGRTTLTMPTGAEVISAANQKGNLVVWALCPYPNHNSEMQTRVFYSLLTGEWVGTDLYRFIDTILFNDGDFVVHLFEVA